MFYPVVYDIDKPISLYLFFRDTNKQHIPFLIVYLNNTSIDIFLTYNVIELINTATVLNYVKYNKQT